MRKYSKILCFDEHTMVRTIEGPLCIKEIRPGTEIISYDEATKTPVTDVVTATAKSLHSECVELVFDNGIRLRATLDHPLLVASKGWCAVSTYGIDEMYGVRVQQLMEGDICMFWTGGQFIQTRVVSIERKQCSEQFYCLSTKNNHTFLANGIIVHDVDLRNFSSEQLSQTQINVSSSKICSVEQFVKEIDEWKAKIPKGELIFRGQANCDWDIVSSAYRYIKTIYPTINITDNVLKYFKSNVQKDMDELKKLNEDINNLQSDDEVMCVLQHLGGKSVFIDFSHKALVALFFSCEKLQGEKDGVVYAVVHDNGKIYNSSNMELGNYKSVELQEGNPASKRVSIQESCFLDSSEMPIISKSTIELKLIIDKDSKKNILKSLGELHPKINHQAVYPDILDYIGNQELNKDVESLKSVVFRETAQLIKDGSIRRMDDAVVALENLSKLRGLKLKDKQRIYFLKARALMCMQKYDEALLSLDELQVDYCFFDRLDDPDENNPDKIDAIDMICCTSFEKAKCYMGKEDYVSALSLFKISGKDVESIRVALNDYNFESYAKIRFDNSFRQMQCDLLKSQSICLVSQNPYNLPLAVEMLERLKEKDLQDNVDSDIANVYVKAGRYEEAISFLKGNREDYSLSLLGSIYIELSKKGNTKLYLEKAEEIYRKAIANLNPDTREYVQKTNAHDHHFKRAMVLSRLKRIQEAEEEYEKLANNPYLNEDAMHDLAYMQYMNHKDDNIVVSNFLSAIQKSRSEKNPRNFNDLGSLLLDVSNRKEPYVLMEILKEGFVSIKNDTSYPESVQVILNRIYEMLVESIKKEDIEHSIFVTLAEQMFIVSDLLNRKDAFANKKLGDIYFSKYENPLCPLRMKSKYAERALQRYILSYCYYRIDGKENPIIKNRSDELEAYLHRQIEVIE